MLRDPKRRKEPVRRSGRKRNADAPETSLLKELREKKENKTLVETECSQHATKRLRIKKDRQSSFVHYLYKNTLGQRICSEMRQRLQEPFVQSLHSYEVIKSASPFDRRIMCLEWHPVIPYTLAVGAKSGDIILGDLANETMACIVEGLGGGESVTSMKFNPFNVSQLFSSSMTGVTSLHDLKGNTITVYANTEQQNIWPCSLDVSQSRKVVAVGDNVGMVLLSDVSGPQLWNKKLHKAKVTHVEFSPCCDWLLATASVDHMVKLWDMRYINDKCSFLHALPHDKPVNSAYFSHTDGCKLLTTDQYDQIRVYHSCDWSKPEKTIYHPHRQFQHLTPIKATWHPLYDLIVVGRYPDERVCPGDLRTIDMYSGTTGELVCHLHDPSAPGIISINKFNFMGNVLGSGMGYHIIIWAQEDVVNGREKLTKDESVSPMPKDRPHGSAAGNAGKSETGRKKITVESPQSTRKAKEMGKWKDK